MPGTVRDREVYQKWYIHSRMITGEVVKENAEVLELGNYVERAELLNVSIDVENADVPVGNHVERAQLLNVSFDVENAEVLEVGNHVERAELLNVTEEVEHSHRVENGKVLEEGQLTEQEHVWQRPGVSQVEPHRK